MSVDLKEQLIVYGYFPEQLPPFFTTDKLFEHYSELIAAIKKPGHGYYDCVSFTIYKSEEARRLLKVPNPIRQLLLIDYILDNAEELERIFDSNLSSLSNPFYEDNYDDLLFFDLPKLKDKKNSEVKSTFLNNLQQKMEVSLGFQYSYKIDIANFYDSIYTHSIEWGFIGREKAKRNQNNNNIGKEIDRLIQNTNSKETAGIPTGPFTSRIISELILDAIDKELYDLSSKNGTIFRFTHYVDDYEFYFRTESDIHKMKNKIIEVFNKYRLKINERKTSIDIYPFHNLKDINKEYQYYIKKYNQTKDKRYLRLLFFKADELIKSDVKGAYKYLYKVLGNKQNINLSYDWSIIEPFLIGHLLIQPSLGQYIVDVILLYKEKITGKLIEELYNNLKISLMKHLHNETQWLLWALFKVEYNFTDKELSFLYKECDDDFTKVMLIQTIYDNEFEKTEEIQPLLEQEIKKLEELNFEDERWFLIHEWYINKWFDYKKLQELYNGNKFYQEMKRHQVSFIK